MHALYFYSLNIDGMMRLLRGALANSAFWKAVHPNRTICTRCLKPQYQLSRSLSDYSSRQIRKTFIEFFRDRHDHQYYPPSSVIPPKGSGTFFTNAGMNQVRFLPTSTLCMTGKLSWNSIISCLTKEDID